MGEGMKGEGREEVTLATASSHQLAARRWSSVRFIHVLERKESRELVSQSTEAGRV